jgi:predicted metal-dependent phosphoesterase TrpH
MPIGDRRIDLHCHTTASDGTLSPSDLVARAQHDDVGVIAVTDHDTVDGVAEAFRAGADLDVRVIAGIELSSMHEGRNVHMLGYFVDPTSLELRSALTDIVAARIVRARAIVEKLNGLGYELTMDEVLGHAGGKVIARPHIARALVARGYINYVGEAFTQELMEDGGRADVPKKTLSSHDAVRLIRRAGGAAVVAHPGVGHHEGRPQGVAVDLLAELRDIGLAGLEVDHPDHAPLQRENLAKLAAELGLVPTGGSDFHGDIVHVIGKCTTTPENLVALEARADSRER